MAPWGKNHMADKGFDPGGHHGVPEKDACC